MPSGPDAVVMESGMSSVCAWLVVNLMRSEDIQAGLLSEQRLAHVFRKRALEHLLAHHRRCGALEERPLEAQAVRVFLEPLGADVPGDVPAPPRPGERALNLADRHRGLLEGDAAAEEAMEVLYVEVSEPARVASRVQGGNDVEFEVDQVQEQEAEQEEEQEEEREREQENEKSQEQEEVVVQEPGRHNFAREDEAVRPWPLHHLGQPPSSDSGGGGGGGLGGLLSAATQQQPPFYPWSRFAVYRAGSAKAGPLQWPARLWLSNN